MVGEGTVVAAGVADHPDEQQLSLFGVLVCHPVEELRPQKCAQMSVYALITMNLH